MASSVLRAWTVDDFFAWQERQDERYELVGGLPLRMLAGASNRHDDVVANIIIALGNRLRGSGCRPFTGDGAVETYPGQIRRPDAGVDCGRRDPNGYRAADPRLVVEVMSPSTRDFDAIGKLTEYKAIEGLEHILYVEPNHPEVLAYSRGAERNWTRARIEVLDGSVPLPALGIELPLAEIYDGVVFPPSSSRFPPD
ncbi:Uma2 family endonuclease [uncultured Enterovirga sp.]|uniref:Uma2 family endonuclease n=1 Tax=uncultured Enterovirga sp. TaxID=2026352 RepID=UPI0035CB1EBD